MEQPSAQFITQILRTFLKPVYALLNDDNIDLIFISPPNFSPVVFSSNSRKILDPIPIRQIDLTIKQLLQALNISQLDSILEFQLLTPLNSLIIIPDELSSKAPSIIIKKASQSTELRLSQIIPDNILEYLLNSLRKFRTLLICSPPFSIKKDILTVLLTPFTNERILAITKDKSLQEIFPFLFQTSAPFDNNFNRLEKLLSYIEPNRLVIELSLLPLQAPLLTLLQNYPGSIVILSQPSVIRALELLSSSLKALLYPTFSPTSIPSILSSLIQTVALFKIIKTGIISLSQIAEIKYNEKQLLIQTIWEEGNSTLQSTKIEQTPESQEIESDTLRVEKIPQLDTRQHESYLQSAEPIENSSEPTEKYPQMSKIIQKAIKTPEIQNNPEQTHSSKHSVEPIQYSTKENNSDKKIDKLFPSVSLDDEQNSFSSSAQLPAVNSPIQREKYISSSDQPPFTTSNRKNSHSNDRHPSNPQPPKETSPSISSERLPQFPLLKSRDSSINTTKSKSEIFNKPTKMVPINQLPQLREKSSEYSQILKLEDVIEDSLPAVVSEDELKEIERELQKLNASPIKNNNSSKNQTIWTYTTTKGVNNPPEPNRINYNSPEQKFKYFDPQELEDTANISQDKSGDRKISGERKGVVVKRGRGKKGTLRSSSTPAPERKISRPPPTADEFQNPDFLEDDIEATIIKGARPPIIKKNR